MTKESKTVIQAIALGLVSNLFLSVGLIVNSLMAFSGSHWAWTASLRYWLLLPFLLIIVAGNRQLKPLLIAMKQMPGTFLIWGNIGFGIFYAFLTFASLFAPGWLVAAGFEITILAGLLLAPFIYSDHRAIIPRKALLLSALLVVSIAVMQLEKMKSFHLGDSTLISLGLTLVAAFLWPLGNRKLMLDLEHRNIHLSAWQRVLGMCLGSLPVLILLAVYGFYESGPPAKVQVFSSLMAALFSGVLGSVLFFKAIQLVRKNPTALATVEATQVTTIFFTLLGEIIFKGVGWPGFYGNLGFLIMLLGLSYYVFLSVQSNKSKKILQPDHVH
ncbi:DMT family transporter [Larkinella punicea]|uniref:Multidrug resistance efflux transporter family protein n=1 Tax=Larkinella punicea TaxID=2315727 RepID=A0A368JMF3_9BACT|nr:multidrug resistance efflux transporter family protein [Larkinella punicea]RCR68226.1 multidrug resistance efflux transporter family protein [Larkinella punicea]